VRKRREGKPGREKEIAVGKIEKNWGSEAKESSGVQKKALFGEKKGKLWVWRQEKVRKAIAEKRDAPRTKERKGGEWPKRKGPGKETSGRGSTTALFFRRNSQKGQAETRGRLTESWRVRTEREKKNQEVNSPSRPEEKKKKNGWCRPKKEKFPEKTNVLLEIKPRPEAKRIEEIGVWGKSFGRGDRFHLAQLYGKKSARASGRRREKRNGSTEEGGTFDWQRNGQPKPRS